MGYLLNKDGKQTRVTDQNVIVSPNDLPSSPLIYDNNRLQDVDNYVRNIAADKHAAKVRQLYPYASTPNIAPDDQQTGYPAPFPLPNMDVLPRGGLPSSMVNEKNRQDNKTIEPFSSTWAPFANVNDTAQVQFEKNVQLTSRTNVDGPAMNPNNGQFLCSYPNNQTSQNSGKIEGFQPFDSAGNSLSSLYSPQQKPIADMTHMNMQPHFGRNAGRNGDSNVMKSRKLEQFTGTAGSDNINSTEWQPRHEVENPFPVNRQEHEKAYVPTDMIRDRTVVSDTHEYTTPGRQIRDDPMDRTTRILPPSIEEQRGDNRKLISYTTPVISGAKGSARAVLLATTDPRNDLTTERGYKDFIPGRAAYSAETVRTLPSASRRRDGVSLEGYMGGPKTDPVGRSDTEAVKDMHKNDLDNRTTKRVEPFTPPSMNHKGFDEGTLHGAFNLREQEKEVQNSRTGPIAGPTKTRNRDISTPLTTLKSTTTHNKTGPINRTGQFKEDSAYRKVRFDLNPTNKSINAKNKYVGPAFKGQKATLRNGKRIRSENAPLLVQDYIHNPDAMQIAKHVDRKNFAQGLSKPVSRLQVRNRVNPGRRGNREDAARLTNIRVTDTDGTPGRFNSGYIKGNLNSLDTGVTLKDDVTEVPVDHVPRRSQNLHNTLALPTLSRHRDVEVINNRLPPLRKPILASRTPQSLVRPSKSVAELYPWLKGEPIDESDSDVDETLG